MIETVRVESFSSSCQVARDRQTKISESWTRREYSLPRLHEAAKSDASSKSDANCKRPIALNSKCVQK
jgi:hypothetical protein